MTLNNFEIYTMEDEFLFHDRTFSQVEPTKGCLSLSQMLQNFNCLYHIISSSESIKSTFRIVCLVFTACRRIVAVKQPRKMDASVHRKNRMGDKLHFYSTDRM